MTITAEKWSKTIICNYLFEVQLSIYFTYNHISALLYFYNKLPFLVKLQFHPRANYIYLSYSLALI